MWQRSQERKAVASLGRATPLAEPPVFVPTYPPPRMEDLGGPAALLHAQRRADDPPAVRKPLSPLSPLSPASPMPMKSPAKSEAPSPWQRAAMDYQRRLQMTATGSPRSPTR